MATAVSEWRAAGLLFPFFGFASIMATVSCSEAPVASIFDRNTLDYISHSEAQTRRLGARLGELAQGGEVIALQGTLGTGKTRWAQGIGLGLQVLTPITSPTFTLVNEYQGRLRLYHIDLYRISEAREALEFGLDEYMAGDGVCVIEWAERALGALPQDHLWITLHHLDDNKRRVTMCAHGEYHRRLLQEFQQVTFASPNV